MRPTVRGLMDGYEGRLEVLILDYDDERLSGYRSRFHIESHPSMAVVARDGSILANFVGVVPRDRLETAVQQAVG